MMQTLLTVFRKEVLDNVRDRRTLASALVMGPLFGPLLFAFVINLSIERSLDDLWFLYTGGTTGMPKGVMWPHEGNWLAMGAGALQSPDLIPPETVDQHIDNCLATDEYRINTPCCPLMHGTGLFNAIGTLVAGGCIVTLTHPSFDPVELFETVARHRVNTLAIVGDAFAKPMLKELDDNPGKYDVSALHTIRSSGVMWSPEVKDSAAAVCIAVTSTPCLAHSIESKPSPQPTSSRRLRSPKTDGIDGSIETETSPSARLPSDSATASCSSWPSMSD